MVVSYDFYTIFNLSSWYWLTGIPIKLGHGFKHRVHWKHRCTMDHWKVMIILETYMDHRVYSPFIYPLCWWTIDCSMWFLYTFQSVLVTLNDRVPLHDVNRNQIKSHMNIGNPPLHHQNTFSTQISTPPDHNLPIIMEDNGPNIPPHSPAMTEISLNPNLQDNEPNSSPNSRKSHILNPAIPGFGNMRSACVPVYSLLIYLWCGLQSVTVPCDFCVFFELSSCRWMKANRPDSILICNPVVRSCRPNHLRITMMNPTLWNWDQRQE